MDDESSFSVEEVTALIRKVVNENLEDAKYEHARINEWSTKITDNVLKELQKLRKPYKYIVNTLIMQKCGAGLHTASACYWDQQTDGSVTVRWENKSMYCILMVYGLAH